MMTRMNRTLSFPITAAVNLTGLIAMAVTLIEQLRCKKLVSQALQVCLTMCSYKFYIYCHPIFEALLVELRGIACVAQIFAELNRHRIFRKLIPSNYCRFNFP